MNYYDVRYLSPTGALGLAIAVRAETPEDAKDLLPIMLSCSVNKPEAFKIIDAVESKTPPLKEENKNE